MWHPVPVMGAVAELAAFVLSPGHDRAAAQQADAVIMAAGQRHDIVQTDHALVGCG
jgi:hypothetical protein